MLEHLKARLKPAWQAWMAFAEVLGWFMSRALLTVLFVAVFTPVSVVLAVRGSDLLQRRLRSGSYWEKRTLNQAPSHFERQF